jgi:NAD(P)-dependent dehydrogenase (short-subunit alcohol dehydrogenase family)
VDAETEPEMSAGVSVDIEGVGIVEEIIDTALNTWGRVDILVNNAGTVSDSAFNTCSAAGILGAPRMSNYGAAKTGLIALNRVAPVVATTRP